MRRLAAPLVALTAAVLVLGAAVGSAGAEPRSPNEGARKKAAAPSKKEKPAGRSGKNGEEDGEGAPKVVSVKTEGDAGVKTYEFGPVEVEGRLKSPQIIYFLRRVRAEFAAGRLGHRSFLRELSDTRRSPALR